MAQGNITIAKSVYHSGDSWYHFYVEFENTVKSNGLSSIFGITTDPFAVSAPARTAAVGKMLDYKQNMAYNDDLLSQYTDLTQPYPVLRALPTLTFNESREYNEWIKAHNSFKQLCVKAFNLLKDSMDIVIWADIINHFGPVHNEENMNVTFLYFKYIKTKYGPPTSVQIKRNRDFIDNIPAFHDWRHALIHLATFQDLINERLSWAVIAPTVNQLTDDDKVNWLIVRLVDPAFSSIKNSISLSVYGRTATWDDCRERVGVTIHMLQSVADLPPPVQTDIAMVSYVDPKLLNKSRSNAVNTKPQSTITCHNCGGLNHKAEHCLASVGKVDIQRPSGPSGPYSPLKRPILEKAQFKRQSYDSYSPKPSSQLGSNPAHKRNSTTFRKPSSLSSSQYEALRKRRASTADAYAIFQASMAEEMMFLDEQHGQLDDEIEVIEGSDVIRLQDDYEEERHIQGGVEEKDTETYD
jgi:hypothetical protein